MFGVTGVASGTTERQIFTFTKSGAVRVPIQNAIFKLNTITLPLQNDTCKINTSFKKKSHSNPDISLPTTTSRIIETEAPASLIDTTPAPISSTQETLDIDPCNIQMVDATGFSPDKILIQITNPDHQENTTSSNQLTDISSSHVSQYHEVHDDGYLSMGSPCSNGETPMDLDILGHDKEFIQEFLVDNVIDTEGLDFQLIDDESSINSDYSADESSNSSDDLSSKLIDTEKDPSWFPNNFELKKVAVIDNSDVHHALFPNKKKSPKKKVQTNNRHKKGPIPLILDDIEDEENVKNIIRCREYRNKKNEAVIDEMTELEQLEEKNRELKHKEQMLKDKVKRIKDMYIKLIGEGRIKFC